jgi:DNA primase
MKCKPRKVWHSCWPHARHYYPGRLRRLTSPRDDGWAKAACPFHDDPATSLWVRLSDRRGYWRCTVCNLCGDLVDFHQRRNKLTLNQAALDLIWRGSCARRH